MIYHRLELSVRNSVPSHRMFSYCQGVCPVLFPVSSTKSTPEMGKKIILKNLAVTWRIHFQNKTDSSKISKLMYPFPIAHCNFYSKDCPKVD